MNTSGWMLNCPRVVGLALEPHVVRGDDGDPRGDGVFHHRALTIWKDLSQVRGSRAVKATVILGQAWGAHHVAEVLSLISSEKKREGEIPLGRNHAGVKRVKAQHGILYFVCRM